MSFTKLGGTDPKGQGSTVGRTGREHLRHAYERMWLKLTVCLTEGK